MEEIRNKLITIYKDYLNEDEINNINKLSEYDIRVIVARIWGMYLTKPENYIPKKNFHFLTCFVSPTLLGYSEIEDKYDELIDYQGTKLELLSQNNLKDSFLGECGFICDIDFLHIKKLFLPDDFKDGYLYIPFKAYPSALFNVNMGEGKASGEYDIAKEIAETLDIPFLSFNKKDYDSNFKMSKIEEKSFVTNIICLYILERYHKMDLNLRDQLVKKYQTYVLKKYQAKLQLKQYHDEEFMKEIFTYLDENEKYLGK